jgi:hypothetical protein
VYQAVGNSTKGQRELTLRLAFRYVIDPEWSQVGLATSAPLAQAETVSQTALAKVQRDRPILGTLSIRRDKSVFANSNRLRQYSSSQQLSSDTRLVTQLHLSHRRCGTFGQFRKRNSALSDDIEREDRAFYTIFQF